MYKISTLLLLFINFFGFSQDKEQTIDSTLSNSNTIINKNIANSNIDTLHTDSLGVLGKKIAVIDYSAASEIDKKWMSSWENSSIRDTTTLFVEIDSLKNIEIVDLPTDSLKQRLAFLNSQTPFHVEYNPSLEKIIKHYLKNRKETFANLMGRAAYYFPMFEEHLDKYNIPLEIKYLAIVESALKPNATSRVGAKGLWQFMYSTGVMYDLKVSSYVDERYDPIKSTEAACKYLRKLYSIFNDWDLALAAYNSGPGNVSKAIRRSGGKKNYWNIRHYLPRETAGYLPAFYATLYIFEYADEHKIYPKNELTNIFETDTILVKQQVSFDQVNRILKIDKELIDFLNPQYKLGIIPYVKNRKYTLRLPVFMAGTFVANEEMIYAYAKAEDANREKPLPKYFEASDRIRYRVRNGDYLGKIARRYGVSVSSIKRWNGLRSNNLRVGQRLTIYPRKSIASNSTNSKKSTTKSKKQPIPKGKYTTYVVKKGDSLWLISQKFPSVTVNEIKNWNNIWSSKYLKPGTKLKIY
ncbi:MAG: LysM peptidoglycan-binding domain-containing protein [Bacteroidota bacterium]